MEKTLLEGLEVRRVSENVVSVMPACEQGAPYDRRACLYESDGHDCLALQASQRYARNCSAAEAISSSSTEPGVHGSRRGSSS